MNAVVDVVGAATNFIPVPGLKTSFGIIKFIWDSVQQASSNKDSLRNLAVFSTEIFMAVNSVLKGNDMNDHIHDLLRNFERVLEEIHDFAKKHAAARLFRMLLNNSDVSGKMDYFHNRLQTLSMAFQIAAYGDIRAQLGKIIEGKNSSPSNARDEGLSTKSLPNLAPPDNPESHGSNSPSSAAIPKAQNQGLAAGSPDSSHGFASAVPLLRAFHPSACDHFYTTDADEMQRAVTQLGYSAEGTAGYIFSVQKDGTIPLFCLYSARSVDHFYTIHEKERDIAAARLGYVNEGTVGYVYPTESHGAKPLFRLYSDEWGDHFYTMSESERDNAVQNIGFKFESIPGYIFPATDTNGAQARSTVPSCEFASAVPLLRAFHPSACDHLYTTDADEMQRVVTQLGYSAEGTAGYIFPVQEDGTIPLFRLYSARSVNHFYTIHEKERDIAAARLGYVNEGTVGYVYPTESHGAKPLFRLYSEGWEDHFYTMSELERDKAVTNIGFKFESIPGYIFPT